MPEKATSILNEIIYRLRRIRILTIESVIKIEDLSKHYKSGKGIENISFELYKGTLVGIAGINGAGKTTLLSIISGIQKEDSGRVIYNFYPGTPKKHLLNDIGVVLRDQDFPNHFTPKMIDKIMRDIYKKWDSSKYISILETLSIDAGKKIKEYSTGMKSSLSLAIALSHGAKLVILDEIMDGIDIISRKIVRKHLFDFVEEESGTVLFTTHELEEIEKLADRLMLIQHGKIFLDKSKEDLMTNYKIFQFSVDEFDKVKKSDVSFFISEHSFVLVIANHAKEFSEKYNVQPINSSLERTIELLIGGETL